MRLILFLFAIGCFMPEIANAQAFGDEASTFIYKIVRYLAYTIGPALIALGFVQAALAYMNEEEKGKAAAKRTVIAGALLGLAIYLSNMLFKWLPNG